MSTSYCDKPRCIQCGLRDSYTNEMSYFSFENGSRELICHDCLEEAKSDKLSTLSSRPEKKVINPKKSESKLYQDFIDEYLFGEHRQFLLQEDQKTVFIKKQEKQLAVRKKIFYGVLQEYKDLAMQVRLLHEQRKSQLDLHS